MGETPARLGRRAFLGGAVAASAAAVGALMMRPPFELWPSLSEFAADYRTGPGERRRVAFDDGVAVELNTRTSLTVHAEVGERRRLELVSGEMTVTTGGVLANPLVIAAGDGRVIGTDARVNVRCDGATASVTCLQGTVRVEYRDRGTTLSERQQISYGKGELGSAAAIDPAVVTAWRGGRLVFHGVPLAQVIDEVNRYRRARIILMNTALGRHAVEATFPLDRTDDLVSLVQKAYGAKVRMLPGGMTILS